MKNKAFKLFGTATGSYGRAKITATLTEAEVQMLRTVKRLTDENFEELLGKYDTNWPLYAAIEAARLSDVRETRNGVTKIIAEEHIIFISTDINKAKIAFANWSVTNE